MFFFSLLCQELFSQTSSPTIILATTTSVQATGLLDVLLPAFSKTTGIEVKPIAIGTGKALELAGKGDADLVLVHARNLEDKFVAEGFGTNAWELMFNDFVVVGPPGDPAKVRGSKSVVEVFRKIASKSAKFISRSDKSGTHDKELEIWNTSKTKISGPNYIEVGQGMTETLKIASELGGYTLCDRATWLFMKQKVNLTLFYENPEELKNPYSVISVSKAKVPKAKTELADKFVDWIVSQEGQKIISEFAIGGEKLFHLSVKKR